MNAKGHDGNSYLTYDNVLTGHEVIRQEAYAKDAAYIGTVNGKIRAKQAGTIMDFNKNDVNC